MLNLKFQAHFPPVDSSMYVDVYVLTLGVYAHREKENIPLLYFCFRSIASILSSSVLT
jgi:hypothetical protein